MTVARRRIRVLQVYRTYFPDSQGGLEEAIRQIALNAGPDIEVQILTLSRAVTRPQRLQVDGITVIRLPLWFELFSCGFAWRGLNTFRQACDWADIIHYHFPWPFADLLERCLVRRWGKKQLLTYHSDIVRQKAMSWLYAPLREAFLRDMDAIVATSPPYARSSPVLQRYHHKLSVIPLGLNENSYPTPGAQLLVTLRATYGENFFLFVGVLRYYKGLEVLLQAAASLPDTRLVIVGQGPEEERLRQQAADLGLDNVVFAGRLPEAEKMGLLQLCRAFVLPSHQRSEAYGISLVEAAMCGKPLISADIGTGTSYVNQHGITGLVVEPGSVASLTAAIRQLDNPQLAAQMGARAREHYRQCMTGEAMGESYSQLYRQLCIPSAAQQPGSR